MKALHSDDASRVPPHLWFLFAVPMVSLATLFKLTIPAFRDFGPFRLALFVTLICAWQGGRAAGIFAGSLGAAATWWFIMTPAGSMMLSSTAMFSLGVFVAEAVAVSFVAGSVLDAKRNVKDVEERYRSLSGSGLVGIFYGDLATGTLVHANDTFLSITGYSAEALNEGRVNRRNLAPAGSVLSEQGMSALATEGRFGPVRCEIIRAAGTAVPALVGAARLPNSDRYVCLVIDQTATVEAEKRVAELLAETQTAIKTRDQFISMASHELKQPLTTLALSVRQSVRIARSGADAANLVQRLEMAERQIQRMAALVNQLLDVSQVNSGRLTLEIETVDLSEVVRTVSDRYVDEFEKANCTLTIDADDAVIGLWDPGKVEQVISNLLSNACKYGRGTPIEVAVRSDAHTVWLTVKDHGIGIAPEHQSRIFDRFERAASQRHYGGFGLGLWIIKEILAAMGGDIHVESAVGRGATFTVLLPRSFARGYLSERSQKSSDPPARQEV